jgi:hypothetical protein
MEEYLKGAGLQPENDQNKSTVDPDALPNSSPAVRQFKTGMALLYGMAIYNAQIDRATGKPNLKIQVRVFKNGQQLFAGKELPFDSSNQKDLKRLDAGGGVSLGASMSPGEYVLQIIVTDMAKNKPQIASQWMDFEITQ